MRRSARIGAHACTHRAWRAFIGEQSLAKFGRGKKIAARTPPFLRDPGEDIPLPVFSFHGQDLILRPLVRSLLSLPRRPLLIDELLPHARSPCLGSDLSTRSKWPRARLGKLNIFLGRTRGEIHGAIPRDIPRAIAIFQRNFICELLRENYYRRFPLFLLIDGSRRAWISSASRRWIRRN